MTAAVAQDFNTKGWREWRKIVQATKLKDKKAKRKSPRPKSKGKTVVKPRKSK